MSPLNSILVAPPPRRSLARLLGGAAALILMLVFAHGDAAAQTGEQGPSDGDVRKAERILAKLRLLHEAADADDADLYRRLVSKMYPDLFVKVAELRPGDLSTDLSTAVFLAEKLRHAWSAAGAQPIDCLSERPDIYRPLCLNLREGNARRLLLAKSRLHARWAEAVVRHHKGESDAETASALGQMAQARVNDAQIAARIVEALRSLEGFGNDEGAARGKQFAKSLRVEGADKEFEEVLQIAGELLVWMPRSQTFYRLSDARQAYADGLSWQRKLSQSKSLVVSVNSFAPDPLKVLHLNAGQASAAAAANWKSAAQQTQLAEQALSGAPR